MAAQKSYSLEQLFRALADSTRLRLLNLMNGRELCVCYFVELLKTSQPKISRHLAYLRGAGLVAARRDGKSIHYRLVPSPAGAEVLASAADALRVDECLGAQQSAPDRLLHTELQKSPSLETGPWCLFPQLS